MRHIRCIKTEVRRLQDCGPYSRSIKIHPLVTVSCTWLPCRQTTGNHSLLFSNQTSVLPLFLPYTPLCTAREKSYLHLPPGTLFTNNPQLSASFITFPSSWWRSSMKCKLFSTAYQFELCSLTFNVNVFHAQSQLCLSLLVALLSSILCLHSFSFSTNFFPNFLPSTAPFFSHLSPSFSTAVRHAVTLPEARERKTMFL